MILKGSGSCSEVDLRGNMKGKVSEKEEKEWSYKRVGLSAEIHLRGNIVA